AEESIRARCALSTPVNESGRTPTMRFALVIALAAVGCTSTGTKSSHSASAPSASSAVQTTAATTPAAAGDATVLTVKGLGCPLCAANVKKSLEAVPGVTSAAVNLGSGKVTVHASAAVTDDQIKGAVSQAGFTLEKIEHPGAAK